MSRIILDHSVPRGLRSFLIGLEVRHAFEQGWHELTNGDLLAAAEQAGFSILVTADRNLRYQNRLEGRQIAIVELSTNHWPTLEQQVERIVAALINLGTGAYVEVSLQKPRLRRRPRPK